MERLEIITMIFMNGTGRNREECERMALAVDSRKFFGFKVSCDCQAFVNTNRL